MSEQPIVRATLAQSNLATAGRFPGDLEAALREAMGPESVRRIDEAMALRWLPVEVEIALAAAVAAHLGPAGARDYWRQTLLDTFERPVLGPIARTAVSVLGPSPASLVRWTPRAWPHIYRGCGTFVAEAVEPRRATLVLCELPEVLRAARPWLVAVGSCFLAFYSFTGTEGDVAVDESAVDRGTVTYRLHWTAEGDG